MTETIDFYLDEISTIRIDKSTCSSTGNIEDLSSNNETYEMKTTFSSSSNTIKSILNLKEEEKGKKLIPALMYDEVCYQKCSSSSIDNLNDMYMVRLRE